MRFRSLCLPVLAALGLGACGSLPDPFTPYGTSKRAEAAAQPTGVLTFDPNVRMKTEEESRPVALAQMEPRRKIKP